MAERKKSSELIGKTVATGEGHIIGTVNEVLVDTQWSVTDLQIKVEKGAAKQMGLKTPLIGSLLILVETARVKAVTDQVLIDIALAEFKDYVDGRK